MGAMDARATSSPSSSEQRPRRTIKAHRKSRRGCLTCRGRKIKCCERRPQCANCAKSGLNCEYPDQQPTAVSTRMGTIQYQSSGFSLQDMRFFHNFITTSFPHLPLDGEQAWKNDIPILAHQHEFLMHAILALGASHLHATTDLELKHSVEKHRSIAMRGLLDFAFENTATEPDKLGTVDRLNAQLATAYALTFCASYMGDSTSFYLILMRSCASLALHIMGSGYSSPLFTGGGDAVSSTDHIDMMRPRFVNAPNLSCRDEVEQAQRSLDKVAEICTFTPVERQIWSNMRGMTEAIDRPFEAYCHLVILWETLAGMDPKDFERFADTSNVTSSALQAHFLALKHLFMPWIILQRSSRPMDRKAVKPVAAPLPIPSTLDEKSEAMFEWPTRYLQADPN